MEEKSKLNFFKPTLYNIGEYSALYKRYSKDLFGCEYSPATILLWEPFYHQKLAVFGESIFLMFEAENRPPIFLLPLGENLKENIELLKVYAKENGFPLYFLAGMGENFEKFKSLFGDEYDMTPSREDFEYIYSAEELKNLSGKKFHSKRNHISAFSRKYNWVFEPLSKENLSEVLLVAEKWAENAENDESRESILSENKTMAELLPFMDELQFSGGIIRVEGQIVAFCFGAKINDTVFDVQVEKALPEFRDAYPVINNAFAKSLDDSILFINREDDMGLEGLRKAKLSYRPKFLFEKFYLSPKGDNK